MERKTRTGSVFDGGETTRGLVGPDTDVRARTRCFGGTLLRLVGEDERGERRRLRAYTS